MNQVETIPPQLNRIQQRSLLVGIAALAICGGLAFISGLDRFLQAYLLGYLFWLHLALGCMAVVMLHHLVGGRWGFVIRRPLESGAMTLPLMAILFIPILAGMGSLYIWTDPEQVAASELLQHKTPYLNTPFFIGRAIFYFVVWAGLAYLLNRWSLRQDEESGGVGRLKAISAAGLILYMLTATFASFDWMMSLEPKWFSSIYGTLFIAGQALITFAFAIIIVRYLEKSGPLADRVKKIHYSDLAGFLLAFVAFWAYIAFSQYLIIWSANLPEEVGWYINRSSGGWQWVALLLIAFHFSLPFVLLLSRQVRHAAQILPVVAGFIILMRLVELFWLVKPAFYSQGFSLHLLDILAPVGIGGIWLWFFIRQLRGKPLLPLRDPRFEEVSESHE